VAFQWKKNSQKKQKGKTINEGNNGNNIVNPDPNPNPSPNPTPTLPGSKSGDQREKMASNIKSSESADLGGKTTPGETIDSGQSSNPSDIDTDLLNSVNGAANNVNGATVENLNSKSGVNTQSSRSSAGGVSRSKPKRSKNIIKTEDKEEGLVDKLSDYIVPLLGLMVFGLLIAFVYVPFGTEALDKNHEIRSLEEDIEYMNDKIEKLESINLDGLNQDTKKVEKVVRDEMEVSELAAQVEELALFNNLEPKELSFSNQAGGESLYRTDLENDSWIPAFTGSISGPFSFYGEFPDVVAFLEDLRNESPTVMFIDAVSISRYKIDDEDQQTEVVEDQLWSVDINIFGFTTPSAQSVNIQDPVRIGGYEEIMQEIEERIQREDEREALEDGDGDVDDLSDENISTDDNASDETSVEDETEMPDETADGPSS
jgi:hypothetical protein